MEALLRARSWVSVKDEYWDSPDHMEGTKSTTQNNFKLLKVASKLFNEDERLVVYTDEQLDKGNVSVETRSNTRSSDSYDPFADE